MENTVLRNGVIAVMTFNLYANSIIELEERIVYMAVRFGFYTYFYIQKLYGNED